MIKKIWVELERIHRVRFASGSESSTCFWWIINTEVTKINLGVEREAAPEIEATLEEGVQHRDGRGVGWQQHQGVRVPKARIFNASE